MICSQKTVYKQTCTHTYFLFISKIWEQCGMKVAEHNLGSEAYRATIAACAEGPFIIHFVQLTWLVTATLIDCGV